MHSLLPSIKLASALLLLSMLASCGKPLPTDKSTYAGEWQGAGVALFIDAKGQVAYRKVEGSSSKSLDLPLKEFQGDNFVVGVGPLSTTFIVSSPPRLVDSVWKMTVDGVELTKTRE